MQMLGYREETPSPHTPQFWRYAAVHLGWLFIYFFITHPTPSFGIVPKNPTK